MRTLPLLVALLLCPAWPAQAQQTGPADGARIAGAQVSGFELSRLSPGLRAEIRDLTGTPLDRRALDDLAARIESEQPSYVAAVRIVAAPDNAARVVFLIARIRVQGRDPNVNARYIVEEVEIRGVPERRITGQLQADRRALAGQTVDSEATERYAVLLRDTFPRYRVSRRLARGRQSGHIRLIYDLRLPLSARWLRFEPAAPNAVFHSEQGWGAFLPLAITARDVRVTPIVALDHADDLIEEFSGFGVRVESRRLGTERLGASFEWTNYDLDWRESTVAAVALDPAVPALYRNRSSITTRLRFAITQRLGVSAGVSIVDLDPLEEDPISGEPLGSVLPSRVANAFVGALTFDHGWRQASGVDHDFNTAFAVRVGSDALESDFTYKRYSASADYRLGWDDHSVSVSTLAGGISGDAPLFERFALGDSRTLRGWDKYDITPTGGNRMVHVSAEYRFNGLALFLDSGSAWEGGQERRFRVSTGIGFHPGPMFFTLGFPLNTDEQRAVFTMGFRSRGWDARVR